MIGITFPIIFATFLLSIIIPSTIAFLSVFDNAEKPTTPSLILRSSAANVEFLSIFNSVSVYLSVFDTFCSTFLHAINTPITK